MFRSPQPRPATAARSRHCVAGVALVEVAVALALLALIIVVSTQAMLHSNREAADMRTRTAARGVVQRNIDNALVVGWDSTVEPPILAVTGAAGAVYDDDDPPNNTDGIVQIATSRKADSSDVVLVTGRLTRFVTTVANPDNATLRQIKFRIDYPYPGPSPYQSVEMTTERAIDD